MSIGLSPVINKQKQLHHGEQENEINHNIFLVHPPLQIADLFFALLLVAVLHKLVDFSAHLEDTHSNPYNYYQIKNKKSCQSNKRRFSSNRQFLFSSFSSNKLEQRISDPYSFSTYLVACKWRIYKMVKVWLCFFSSVCQKCWQRQGWSTHIKNRQNSHHTITDTGQLLKLSLKKKATIQAVSGKLPYLSIICSFYVSLHNISHCKLLLKKLYQLWRKGIWDREEFLSRKSKKIITK